MHGAPQSDTDNSELMAVAPTSICKVTIDDGKQRLEAYLRRAAAEALARRSEHSCKEHAPDAR